MTVLFITGIDTDIGKTYATGWLAKTMQAQGKKVITQKLVQTGCIGIADDIITHRQMMSIDLQQVDKDGITCPYVYPKPASPHFSASLVNDKIDPERISSATKQLEIEYEIVLLEGAGGVLVPLNNDLLTLDYISECQYPVVLVTSGRLGSINHTLLSIEAISKRGLQLHSVIYNHYLGGELDTDRVTNSDEQIGHSSISNSTKDYLQRYLQTNYPKSQWLELPLIV
ncbi:dethiobiotin synthase [Psychrobacter sp. I-STPA10]|uniref:dethiobiotin synthase n=1 Tax=Psychrobacter sp. I-STPA10 TaxID=2585769 RepID=UPI0022A8AE19